MLYVPGSNERALKKAHSLAADMIVFDLEDGVAPDAKAAARARVAAYLSAANDAPGGQSRLLAVRINGLDSAWGAEDLQQFAALSADALLLPKVSAAKDLAPVQKALDEAGSPARIWAMLETPLGVLNAQSIAAARGAGAARLALFVMGLNDLALQMHLPPGSSRAGLSWARSQCIMAARAYELDIVDGVSNRYDDEAALRTECEDGRALGFDGKSLIHPAQIKICNEVFSPTTDEIAAARKILLASEQFDAESHGAIAVDGMMVEELHVEAARRVLARAAEK